MRPQGANPNTISNKKTKKSVTQNSLVFMCCLMCCVVNIILKLEFLMFIIVWGRMGKKNTNHATNIATYSPLFLYDFTSKTQWCKLFLCCVVNLLKICWNWTIFIFLLYDLYFAVYWAYNFEANNIITISVAVWIKNPWYEPKICLPNSRLICFRFHVAKIMYFRGSLVFLL